MDLSEIVKLAKGDSEAQNSQQLFRITQCEQEHYEMHVRAANIVRKLFFPIECINNFTRNIS